MLSIQKVSKTFHKGTLNEVRALTDVSIELTEGSFLIIIGMNGSGKSTILNAVAGSFPVDSGSIQLSGKEITGWPEHRRARLVARVFQNPFSGTAPAMTIAENLTLAARRGRSRGLGPALTPRIREEIQDRIRVLNMGLENRLDNPIGTLSGGQRQALTLLMATWLKPDLLLLDEHTAALDPKSAAQVIQLTHEIVAREQITTLMVTHSMQQAVDLGDRIVMMHKGQVLHDISGAARTGIKAEDLLRRFEDLQRAEELPAGVHDIDLFRALDQKTLARLSACMEERSIREGQKFFSCGDQGDEIFFVRRGCVQSMLPLEGGKRHHLATFGRGDFFGELSFLDRRNRFADAEAKVPTDVYVLSRTRFDQEVETSGTGFAAEVFAQLTLTMAQRVRQNNAELQALEPR